MTNVEVVCNTSTFTVGGSVTGLTGSGLVLQNNGTDDISVSEGAFTFPTPLASGSNFNVTVQTQPGSPTQTCSVSGGTGTIGTDDVTSVVVNCATDSFTVGGLVSGLAGTVVLQNNGGDDLTVTADGSFAFPSTVMSGSPYAVTVLTDPSSPSQTCAVTAGSGNVAGDDVTSVRVDCTTDRFTIGGTLSGLAATGLVLQNNAGDNLPLAEDGAFTFATSIESGADYAVTILSQPSNPSQVCSIGGGSGTVGSANVSDVTITCSISSFTVGGTVSGLAGSGLTLQNNGGDGLSINENGAFTFSTPVASGADYAVTVSAQPGSPTQTCTVSAGSGSVGSGNVTTVTVNCATNAFTIGGTISGLAGSVVLQNNAADDLTVSSDGSFAFSTPISSGGSYAVSVGTQPTSPSQTCTVSGGSGSVGGANVTSVSITCTTDQFTVGGAVSGLTGSGLVLQNNAGDDLAISGNGPFTFGTSVASGGTYAVTASANPTGPSQTCVVTNDSGVIGGANVTDVTVTCTTNTYPVGGTVTGVAGTGLVLQNNGGSNFSVNENGAFSFPAEIVSGGTYAVTVFGQPSSPTQSCTVSNGSGTVIDAAITSVTVTCTTNQYSVGGTVSGLSGSGLVLQNNLGDNLAIGANGAFTFATDIDSGAAYDVTVQTQPSSPAQTCTVTGGSGTVGAADVTSVSVNCATNQYTIGGTVSGLTGTGLVLQNNGGDDVSVTANGDFAFSSPINSGQGYAVTVLTQPSGPGQTCTLSNDSGTVGSADVTNVTVSCTTDTYTVGGTVSGLATGQSLVLRNNGANDLSVSSNGGFTFTTPVASGGAYAVTVLTQPDTPVDQTCTVTNDAGIIGSANVTNVTVTCTANTYTVSGGLTGLTSGSVTIQNNAGDDLTLSADAPFSFTTPVASGNAYAVTVSVQPAGLLCGVTNGSGTITNANVTNVSVTCGVAPTGGTITTSGGYRIHTFTSNGTFETFSTRNVEYLIVAGGGGGGSGDGGGGGAGGVLEGSTSLATNTYAVVVGAGGAGARFEANASFDSQNGADSTFAGLTAIGGGRGGEEDSVAGGGGLNAGGAGGSGGGFGGANLVFTSPFPAGGAGTAGQGNAGGTRGPTVTSQYGMGGGGGAGGAGGDGTEGNNGGNGGPGISSSISGSAVFYGGGGGGSGRGTSAGAGGSGGGGAGGLGSNANGTAGTANTGGGGGGGGDQASTGGTGGSGIVIVRYLL